MLRLRICSLRSPTASPYGSLREAVYEDEGCEERNNLTRSLTTSPDDFVTILVLALVTFLITLLFSANQAFGYGKTHAYITEQAFKVWPGDEKHEIYQYLKPQPTDLDFDGLSKLDKLRKHELVGSQDESETSTTGGTILEGAVEEDHGVYVKILVEWKWWMDHAWNPDNNETWSVPVVGVIEHTAVGKGIWMFNEACIQYKKGNKPLAYWYLGRAAHCLEDMSVPAHALCDIHALPWLSRLPIGLEKDRYEEWADKRDVFNIALLKPLDLNSKELLEPPSDVATTSRNPQLEKLFYNLAQAAQWFPSNETPGNSDNVPSFVLQENWPSLSIFDLQFENNLYAMGSYLLPRAIQFTATLYRLFWETTHFPSPPPTQDTADIILTIDRSGSMENPISETNNTQRIVVARQAAEEFTHFVIPGDYVGIVDYAGDVKVTQPLSSVYTNVIREKISQVQVGGSGTNIGAPLGKAYQEFESSSSGNTSKVVILLTDGAHNTGTEPLTVVQNSQNFTNQHWPIYTIGLGSGEEFNEPLLQEIAKETGGQYKHASSAQELGDFYATLAARIRGGTTLVRLRDFINQGQTITHAVEFDPLIETSHLILNWGGSQLELKLMTPQGESITPTTVGIEYSSGENYLIYKINQPESGKWFANIHGSDVPAGGEQYILSITGTSDVISSLLPFKPRYNPSDKISIGVELLARGLKKKPANITNITAEAHILRPDGLTETVFLSDIGEGVYAGDYTNTAFLGSYLITVELHGTILSGAPFSRNITEAVIVGDIYQILISQTSLRPEPESVVTNAIPTIQARISGPSRNIDAGSINLTLDNAVVPHTYDPVNQLISYKSQTELFSGKHLVTLSLKNAQGSAIPKAHWQFIVDTEADYWFLHGETQRLMRLSVKDDEVRVVKSIKGVDPQGVYVIDRRDGTCWFASPHLGKVNCYGGASIFSFGELGAPMVLAIDDANRTLWVADGGLNQVVKCDLAGNIQEHIQLASPPRAIAARADGGLWVATSRRLHIITANGKLTEAVKQKVKYLQAVPKTDEIWTGDSITGHVFHISGDGSIIAEGGVKKLSGIAATNDGGCWLEGRKTAFALNPDGSLRGTVQGLSNPRTVIFQPSDGSVWVQEGSNQLLRLYRPVSEDASFLRITGLTFGNLAIKPATDIKWTPSQPETPPQPAKDTVVTKPAKPLVPAVPEIKSEESERREENEEEYQGHWKLIPRDTTILMTADMTVVRNDDELIQATPIKDIIPLLNQINLSTADVTQLTLWGISAQESSNIDGAVLVTGQYQVKRVLEHLHQAGWKRELYGQDELYLNPQEEAESVAGISDDTIALGSINALKTVLDVKHQKQGTIWQRRDLVTLLRNSASSDAPVTVALLIPQDVFDMANAALTISRSILSLFRVPVIGILMEKIGVAQAVVVHISRRDDSFPVELFCLMADEDAASFLSGTLNLLKKSTSAFPKDGMDVQSQEAMELLRQMKVSREERLFYIQMVVPHEEFVNIQK